MNLSWQIILLVLQFLPIIYAQLIDNKIPLSEDFLGGGECQSPSQISVIGQGIISVTSDMATISLSIEGLAATAIEARALVANTSEKVADALKVLVTPENMIPSSVTITPQYKNSNTQGQIVEGYKYSSSLDLHIDNVTTTNIASILDSAAFAGQRTVNIQRIAYSLSPEMKLFASKRARISAISDARNKATEFATQINATLGGILGLSEYPPNSAATGLVQSLPTPPRQSQDVNEVTEGTTITVSRNELTSVIFIDFGACPN